MNLSDAVYTPITTRKRKKTLRDFSKLNPWSTLCAQIVSGKSKSSTSQSTNKWFKPRQKEVGFAKNYQRRFASRDSKTLFGQVPLESLTIYFSTQDKKVLGEKNVVSLEWSSALTGWRVNLKTKTSNYLWIIGFLHYHSRLRSKQWEFYQFSPFPQIALMDAHWSPEKIWKNVVFVCLTIGRTTIPRHICWNDLTTNSSRSRMHTVKIYDLALEKNVKIDCPDIVAQ